MKILIDPLKSLNIYFFIIIGLVFFTVLILIGKLATQKCEKTNALLMKIKSRLFFKPFLRLSLQSYLKLCEITFAYFYDPMMIPETNGSIAQSIITAVYIGILPSLSFMFLKKNQEKLNEEEFKTRFSSLYLGIDCQKKISIFWPIIFFLRRLGLSLVVTFLRDVPSAQLIYL